MQQNDIINSHYFAVAKKKKKMSYRMINKDVQLLGPSLAENFTELGSGGSVLRARFQQH